MLGPIFDRFGWTACVAAIAASLGLTALLVGNFKRLDLRSQLNWLSLPDQQLARLIGGGQ